VPERPATLPTRRRRRRRDRKLDRRASRRKAHRIAVSLSSAYGSPRHGNKDDPFEELVFIVLSQVTTHHSYGRVFDRLRGAVASWNELLVMPLRRLKALIKDAGLSGQKAPRLKAIARRLTADFGQVTLDPLQEMSDEDAEKYLTSLPGVGVKSARCVLMYAFGRELLPVDTHVWRVARRLGLLPHDLPYGRVHNALEDAVAPADRYAIHVNAIAHGRRVCLPLRPRCGECCLRRACAWYHQGGQAARKFTSAKP